jgi:uncharacterized protein (DUF927 family)/phage/plasmid primase-like uncharacterized protein
LGEVVAALGIDPGKRGHQRCPLPGHDDEHPSFRWDSGKECFFCTCGSGDALDLIQAIEGVDFPEAVKRVAEILGLRGNGRGRATATPADEPPEKETKARGWAACASTWADAHDLDDPAAAPGRAYLEVRGLKTDFPLPEALRLHPRLAYREGETTGIFPAILGRVVDVAGEPIGLQRIWLAPDGSGKAPLPDGLPAKKALGALAGGAVRLDEPRPGEPLVVAEGLETALAVRQATGWATWAAVSASVMAALVVPAEVAEAVIAADLDRSKAGEEAARKLAARLHAQGVRVRIALPAGEIAEGAKGVDWLDVLNHAGTEAVREAIDGAEEWEPTTAADFEPGDDWPEPPPLVGVAATLGEGPLPWANVKTPRGYRLGGSGVFLLKDEGDERLTTCPVWTSALARDHAGTGWGHLVEWLDRDGAPHKAAFPAGRFHEEGGGLIRDLADAGLGVVPGKQRRLLAYLGSFEPALRFRSTPQLGWVDATDGRLAYVLPEEVIERQDEGETSRERVVFQPERFAPTTETMHPAGTLADWHREVVAPCAGNPILIYALARAFAPPLFKLAGVEGGGEHWYGRSTGGKTTMAQVSASTWGCGADPAEAPAAAFVRKWNATRNATEGLAAAHNDGLLILDEIGEADARDFGKVVYMLAGGVGKARMNDAANLRASRTWQVFLVSTGETSSRVILEADGHTAKAGQLVRLLDIPAEGADGGIFHDTHGLAPAVFADQLKHACAQVYGTAGPAFVCALVALEDADDRAALRRELRERVDRVTAELTPPNSPPEVRRAVRRFALVDVAGTLACGFGILPFEAPEIRAAVELVRDRWLAERGVADDIERAVESVRAFILRHEARFRETTDRENALPVRDLVGYRDRIADRYLFTPAGFKEACAGFDVKAVARELARRGWLHKDQSDRFTSKASIAGLPGRVSVYAVSSALLEGDVSRDPTGQRDTDGTAKNPAYIRGCPAVPSVPLENGGMPF